MSPFPLRMSNYYTLNFKPPFFKQPVQHSINNLMCNRGDWEVSICNRDYKISSDTPYTRAYPALHPCSHHWLLGHHSNHSPYYLLSEGRCVNLWAVFLLFLTLLRGCGLALRHPSTARTQCDRTQPRMWTTPKTKKRKTKPTKKIYKCWWVGQK